MSPGNRTSRPTPGPDDRLAEVAAGQLGLLTRAQALAELSPSALGRRLAAGRLRIVLPTVYAVSGAPETWRQRALAACFWSGGFASHGTAAALHGLKGFGIPTTIEVVVSTRDMRSPRSWLKIHRTNDLPAVQRTSIGSIPTTSVSRTLIDLAHRTDEMDLGAALDDALMRGVTSIDHLVRQIARIGGPGRAGVSVLRSLVADRAGHGRVPFNMFERKLKRVLDAAALPNFEPQRKVESKGRTFYLDFAFPSARLGIEADGYRYHGGRTDWEHDEERRTLLTLAGWRVLHVSWKQLCEKPELVIARIREALGLDQLWDVEPG